MRLHYLQHVPFEDAGEIAAWARERGHGLTFTRLDRGEPLPAQDGFDWLIVMGGPMNVYEHDEYPWLVAEKELIRRSIAGGKLVLGVCLGAQLVADVLGGPVVRNDHKEIGWHGVALTPDARRSAVFADWPARFDAFHWHGDTFALPPGAIHVAGNVACRNQAFIFGDRVVGLQFHIEYSADSVRAMIRACGDEIGGGGPYVQDADALLKGLPLLGQTRRLLYGLLDRLAERP